MVLRLKSVLTYVFSGGVFLSGSCSGRFVAVLGCGTGFLHGTVTPEVRGSLSVKASRSGIVGLES